MDADAAAALLGEFVGELNADADGGDGGGGARVAARALQAVADVASDATFASHLRLPPPLVSSLISGCRDRNLDARLLVPALPSMSSDEIAISLPRLLSLPAAEVKVGLVNAMHAAPPPMPPAQARAPNNGVIAFLMGPSSS